MLESTSYPLNEPSEKLGIIERLKKKIPALISKTLIPSVDDILKGMTKVLTEIIDLDYESYDTGLKAILKDNEQFLSLFCIFVKLEKGNRNPSIRSLLEFKQDIKIDSFQENKLENNLQGLLLEVNKYRCVKGTIFKLKEDKTLGEDYEHIQSLLQEGDKTLEESNEHIQSFLQEGDEKYTPNQFTPIKIDFKRETPIETNDKDSFSKIELKLKEEEKYSSILSINSEISTSISELSFSETTQISNIPIYLIIKTNFNISMISHIGFLIYLKGQFYNFLIGGGKEGEQTRIYLIDSLSSNKNSRVNGVEIPFSNLIGSSIIDVGILTPLHLERINEIIDNIQEIKIDSSLDFTFNLKNNELFKESKDYKHFYDNFQIPQKVNSDNRTSDVILKGLGKVDEGSKETFIRETEINLEKILNYFNKLEQKSVDSTSEQIYFLRDTKKCFKESKILVAKYLKLVHLMTVKESDIDIFYTKDKDIVDNYYFFDSSIEKIEKFIRESQTIDKFKYIRTLLQIYLDIKKNYDLCSKTKDKIEELKTFDYEQKEIFEQFIVLITELTEGNVFLLESEDNKSYLNRIQNLPDFSNPTLEKLKDVLRSKYIINLDDPKLIMDKIENEKEDNNKNFKGIFSDFSSDGVGYNLTLNRMPLMKLGQEYNLLRDGKYTLVDPLSVLKSNWKLGSDLFKNIYNGKDNLDNYLTSHNFPSNLNCIKTITYIFEDSLICIGQNKDSPNSGSYNPILRANQRHNPNADSCRRLAKTIKFSKVDGIETINVTVNEQETLSLLNVIKCITNNDTTLSAFLDIIFNFEHENETPKTEVTPDHKIRAYQLYYQTYGRANQNTPLMEDSSSEGGVMKKSMSKPVSRRYSALSRKKNIKHHLGKSRKIKRVEKDLTKKNIKFN